MDVDAAVVAPRFTLGAQLSTGNADLAVESRVGERVLSQLRDLGHAVRPIGAWQSGGAVQLIARDPASGMYQGATEVRRAPCTVLAF